MVINVEAASLNSYVFFLCIKNTKKTMWTMCAPTITF